tara:strand:- start:11321 stop:12283 length:963 start_codon:yes stop_codon:yes gene_type:complete
MVILGSSDTGAVKYLSNLNRFLKNKAWVLEDNKKSLIKNIPYLSLKDVKKAKKIKLIITGSAIGNSIDKKLISLGRSRKIFTISIIEHWTNYYSRFIYKKKIFLPDLIFVNDLIAYNDAIKAGIPKKKLIVMGNIHFENLSKSNLKKNLSPWAQKIKNQNKKIIFFLSENILKHQKYLAKEYKTDEFQTIKNVITAMSKNDILVIKCHPEEKIKKFKHFAKKNIIIKKKVNFSDIVNLPDFIIGIKSIILLELSLFRKDIISYRPLSDNKFIGDKIKCTKLVRRNLKRILNKKFNDNIIFKNYFNGSGKKVKTFLEKKLI